MNKRSTHNKTVSMNINNSSVKDPDIVAKSFNSFFSSVAQNSIHEPLDNDFIQNSMQNLRSNNSKRTTAFYFKPTSKKEINKIIKFLKTKNSHGYDEISSRILKISAPCILSPLTYIFIKIIGL